VSSRSDVAVVTVPGESAGPTLLDRSRSPQLNSQFQAVRPPLFSLVASFQPTFDSHTKIDSQSEAHFDIIHRSSSSTFYKTSLQNTVHISCRTLCQMNTIHSGMRTGVVTSCICHLLKRDHLRVLFCSRSIQSFDTIRSSVHDEVSDLPQPLLLTSFRPVLLPITLTC
jgi:hypothetical protein